MKTAGLNELQSTLRGFTQSQVDSDDDVKEDLYLGPLKSFFSQGKNKLVEWYKKLVNLQGHCVEKWCNHYVHMLIATDIKWYVVFTYDSSLSVHMRIQKNP